VHFNQQLRQLWPESKWNAILPGGTDTKPGPSLATRVTGHLALLPRFHLGWSLRLLFLSQTAKLRSSGSLVHPRFSQSALANRVQFISPVSLARTRSDTVWNRLKALFQKKSSTTSTNSSESPQPVQPHEHLTRFIFSSDHFNPNTGRVRPAAVSPYLVKETGRVEWSVFRTTGLTSMDLWSICTQHVDRPDRKAKARGTFPAATLLDLELHCDPDGKPHTHHVNVLGWPDSKDRIKILQQKIAAAMSEHLETRPKD